MQSKIENNLKENFDKISKKYAEFREKQLRCLQEENQRLEKQLEQIEIDYKNIPKPTQKCNYYFCCDTGDEEL